MVNQLQEHKNNFEDLQKEIQNFLDNKSLKAIQEVTYRYSDITITEKRRISKIKKDEGEDENSNNKKNKIEEDEYIYEELFKWKINETLFIDFAWFNKVDIEKTAQNNRVSLWEIIKDTKKALLNKIKQIDYFIDKLKDFIDKNILEESEKIKIEFYINSLEYTKKTLLLAFAWVEFEAEKISWITILDEENREKILEEIEFLEGELFWWRIIDNSEETQACVQYIADFYWDFSEEDKEYFQDIINKINISTWFNYSLEEIYNNTDTNNSELSIKEAEKQDKIKNILDTKISQKQYLKIFRLAFEIYWLNDDFKITTSSWRWSIYDSFSWLDFDTGEQYQEKTIWWVLSLLAHEIERHLLTFKANKDNIWMLEWGDKLPLEEWVAKLMEEVLSWKKLEDIKLVSNFPRILAAEVLNIDDAFEFCNKLWEYDWIKWWEARKNRLKRNYPMNEPWTQHKDTVYFRWLLKTIKYVKENQNNPENMAALFLWKAGFNDLENMKNITWTSLNSTETNKAFLPVFLAELIKFILVESDRYWIWEQKNNYENFLDYLKEKYPFLNLDEHYKNVIQEFTGYQKDAVRHILYIIEDEIFTEEANLDYFSNRAINKYNNRKNREN